MRGLPRLLNDPFRIEASNQAQAPHYSQPSKYSNATLDHLLGQRPIKPGFIQFEIR